MTEIKLIAFDADDTLWHNETYYRAAREHLIEILAPYASSEQVAQRLDDVEHHNIRYFGYGIKSYVLSMIETGVSVSGERIQASEIQRILNLGKEMLAAETQVFDEVETTLALLSKTHALMVITKGDLMDQEAKLARSGLAGYFQYVEIVSEKDSSTYQKILDRLNVPPEGFVMVGNSLKSDIYPVVALGGKAVYIPYADTWFREIQVDPSIDPAQFIEIEHIAHLPAVIEQLSQSPDSNKE